jgi:hypothetical protein
MAEKLVRRATAFEFFREQLVEALDHQKVSASEFTECYLVNLLAAFTQGDRMPGREPGYDEVPLALLYLRALGVSRRERARRLRAMADTALFVSGFFTDSLTGRDGVLRYYVTLGGQAYARLGRDPEEDALSDRKSSRSLPCTSGTSSTCWPRCPRRAGRPPQPP